MNHEQALQAAGTIRKIESVDVITQSASLFNTEAVVRAYLEARAEGESTLPDNVLDEYPDFMMARCLLADFGDTT